MEKQIEYFSIFGGLGWRIDMDRSPQELIISEILDNYGHLHNELSTLSLDEPEYARLLHALATGDRRLFKAFNRAGLNNKNGGAAIDFLQNNHILEMQLSRERDPRELHPNHKLKREDARHRISHKMRFTKPFIRFWFYFIYPHSREIQRGIYENMLKRFQIHQYSYTSLVFEELSELLLDYYTRDDQILTSGSYWDANIEIDLLAITKSQKIYVGECKWTNHKINKKELHKLLDKCVRLGISPAKILLFAKRGFSKELLQMQSPTLALYSAEEFSILLKNISSADIRQGFFIPN
jgi:AAA+ ATPase superfamily predicted ATPase